MGKFSEVLMAGEEAKKVEPALAEASSSVPTKTEDKTVISPEESKALVVIANPEAAEEKKPQTSTKRDAVLARVATEKKLSLIRAWEESEKSKAENKAQKKISAIASWENSKKASIEAELKKMEEALEKKKAEYREKMQNKVALVRKEAEEKRASVEAKREEDLLKAEEEAAKYRATGTTPKKLLLGFFQQS